jgi:hypothetical protein
MTIDHSKDGLTEVDLEGLRDYVKAVQEKKKLQLALKMRHSRKTLDELDKSDNKGAVYEEGKGYL